MIQIMEFKDSCNKIGLPDEKLWLLNSCCYGGWPEVGFFSPIFVHLHCQGGGQLKYKTTYLFQG